MDVIEGVSVGPMTPESQFVRPLRMYYKQNKVDKVWDLVSLHDSVCVILFNTDRQKVVLVRQFRPAVYYNGVSVEERQALGGCVDTAKHPGKDGLTLELCAGIVDKQLSLAEVAQLEALEECGYNVPVEKFEHVKTCRAGVGVSGDRMTMFYAEVTDAMKESEGGGLEAEGEMIEVVEMGLPEVKEFLAAPEVTAPSGLLFGLTWFLYNKAPGVSTSTTTTNT
ncbi:uridine diphosphate glucose pyrophosphatase NUDT14-like [Eriocheir sinensis]|uniref:uridine diphosphate glucose pyrophosphatase NUDT14-like n=1 Tax=Eriocheir sinensis TaxID=95602 RepID=UPI0021C826C7|nr:uridine diphosphate glucose pyrophosphatase NUDT14-like [Eriocheir sinensis]